ncbi:MAG: ABC transporter ATP-binding protein [Verrucomicrobia bacterium]|nr:ABC transporter ATP-binding protein [Verrucomicrobiota bacterium]MBI3868202.1 ABC transporter ATP-binding protein [Verrucomicrobiota bacterium]
MNPPVIDISNLHYTYDGQEAVCGLNLQVAPGRCHALLGRNGAGKTTTMKCLLHLLRPQAGTVRLFGLDPAKDEVAVRSRLSYVPDAPSFYPWMSVRETLEYLASFRARWNLSRQSELLDRFSLDPGMKVTSLSKGQRTQLALIGALAPEPDLLILDEPTSGLDPIVRREFIQTVIGAFQEGDASRRTIFVSTHLIGEFEGLIDEFTLLDQGKAILSLDADKARERYRRIRARFPGSVDAVDVPGGLQTRRHGREVEVIANGDGERIIERLRAQSPESLEVEGLTLEEVFMVTANRLPKEKR